MRSEICRLLITAILVVLPLIGPVCLAKETSTLIIYPKVKPPVQQLYTTIIEGIQQTLPLSETLTLDNNNQAASLEARLKQIKPNKIIALGRTTAESVVQSGHQNQLIVAATRFDSDVYSGVSLAIDSRILLNEIQSFLPFVKRVFVLGSPIRPSIAIYPESLHGQPFMIPKIQEDPLVTTRQLWKLLETEASKTDVIILPSQLDRDILYEVVQKAWEKKIILLSTNLAHLKEGVLMVFYPDNEAMGRQIGAFLLEHQDPGYESLAHITSSFNPTIAQHLGLEFTAEMMSRFQLQVK